MSDEEHQFESKADAGASKTYPQQAGTIRKNGYIVIKGRPCKVVEVSTSKTGKHGHAKCHFVPHVNRTDYQLIDISEDGFVSLLTENGNTKDDLRLPTDDSLLTQIKDGFGDGKDLVVSVMSAMGEEQICGLKDIGPKLVLIIVVPHVNRTDYQLIDISEDGFVSLLTENGNTKDELRLPTDDNLLTQIKNGFGDGKDLVVSVMSAMGEEQICDLKDIGPK
ncbi:eukaryotic translation initiation factor 5a-2 [Quercus suber]|uniref:Eukaryotic translation initiation factor 5a-2 n=1 Tax=Quercus suber TaxID=58331 RepID=A0AAW0KC62_QUESU